jgi:hypothetical protein
VISALSPKRGARRKKMCHPSIFTPPPAVLRPIVPWAWAAPAGALHAAALRLMNCPAGRFETLPRSRSCFRLRVRRLCTLPASPATKRRQPRAQPPSAPGFQTAGRFCQRGGESRLGPPFGLVFSRFFFPSLPPPPTSSSFRPAPRRLPPAGFIPQSKNPGAWRRRGFRGKETMEDFYKQ